MSSYDIAGFDTIEITHEIEGSFGYVFDYIVGLWGISFAPILLTWCTVFIIPFFVALLSYGTTWLGAWIVRSPVYLIHRFDSIFWRLGFFYFLASFVKFTRKDGTWWTNIF